MPELKIGIQLRSLQLPFKRALEMAKKLGATAVEIDARGEIQPAELTQTGLRQLRKMLEDLELRVAAVGYRTRRGYHVAEDLDRRIAGTKSAMKFAHELGTNVVINQVGRVPEKSEGPDWQRLTSALMDLGNYGDRVGAYLAAETGSESGPDLARLLAALPPGSMAVNLDPGNLLINGFSVIEAIESLRGAIIHVHAKDGVRDLAQGRGVEVPLGRGAADFPAILGALEEFGYRGYFTIERDRAENPVVEVGQAVEYLRSL
jgi:sugar phosphate isomerase/epimerase